MRIEVPRDRDSGFEPLRILKHERRLRGLGDRIIAMYVHGTRSRARPQAQACCARVACCAAQAGRPPLHELQRTHVPVRRAVPPRRLELALHRPAALPWMRRLPLIHERRPVRLQSVHPADLIGLARPLLVGLDQRLPVVHQVAQRVHPVGLTIALGHEVDPQVGARMRLGRVHPQARRPVAARAASAPSARSPPSSETARSCDPGRHAHNAPFAPPSTRKPARARQVPILPPVMSAALPARPGSMPIS